MASIAVRVHRGCWQAAWCSDAVTEISASTTTTAGGLRPQLSPAGLTPPLPQVARQLLQSAAPQLRLREPIDPDHRHRDVNLLHK